MPRMLLDIQNRGQLAAGMTTYNPRRNQLIDTYKDVGTVSEVFRLSHRGKFESADAGVRRPGGHRPRPLRHLRPKTTAATPSRSSGTTSRSTSGSASPSTASWPTTWSCATNCSSDDDNHLARETDTEIIMHEISRELSGDRRPPLIDVMPARSPSGSTGRTAWCSSTPWAT